MRAAVLLGLTLTCCVASPDPWESTCESGPTSTVVRRLTRAEYDSTVFDLFGDATHPASALPAEEEVLGFSNNAGALTVTPALAEMYLTVAEGVAERATEDVLTTTGCPESALEGAAPQCVRAYVERIARRAYRRPLETGEASALMGIFEEGRRIFEATPPPERFRHCVAMVLEAILLSPDFLYRLELEPELPPEGTAAEGGFRQATSIEMASRLSYFLWGTTPDEELLSKGERGELATREAIAETARQMLASPKASEAVARFHQDWLEYDRVSNVSKDATLFPDWSPEIAVLMRQEMRTFIDRTVLSEGGSLKDLLSADHSYLNRELGAFYGMSVPSDDFVRVELPRSRHAGLISMGAMLAYYAHSNQSSPVHRGKFVREMFLCDTLSPPPNNVSFDVPEPSPDATTRERFAIHSEGEACAGCHKMMDPIGFGLENFDGVGRFRLEENGHPIDASGELFYSDVDGPFVGIDGLTERLAMSEDVETCYATEWFRYAMGRAETDADECTLDALTQAFRASGGDIQELIVALTQTDAFLMRHVSPRKE